MGLFAGLAGGYIAYEFREIFRAIPKAWHMAKKGSFSMWDEVIAWAKGSRPFSYLYILITITTGPFIFTWLLNNSTATLASNNSYSFVFSILVTISITLVLSFFWLIFATAYAEEHENYYWTTIKNKSDDSKKWCEEMQAKGYSELPLTNFTFIKLGIKAIFWGIKQIPKLITTILRFSLWTIWKNLAISLYKGFCFVGRFIWHLFKLIHSDKRLLCAIDGTLGGLASYQWLSSSATSSTEQVLVAIFGGLIGAVLGIANWELVSKRILHIATDNI